MKKKILLSRKRICISKKKTHIFLVEGGKNTIENFINENLWDEARVFRSKSYLIKKGLRAPNLPSTSNFDKLLEIDNDELSIYQNAILRTL